MRKRAGNLGRSPRRAPHPDLGELVTGAREASGLTVPELARRIGVSERYVQYLQVGARCPSAVMAGRLQVELGVPIPMPAIAAADLSPGSLGRIRRAQAKALAALQPPPAAPVEPSRPVFVNGWGGF
jgi:ribosome-binding protein aMBF1 (putative translation factor)